MALAARSGADDGEGTSKVSRLRTSLPVAVAMAVPMLLGAPARAAMPSVSAAGVQFSWTVQGESLHGCMSAATSGWVAVGFNTRTGLQGARLVMGHVVAGRAHAEVHIAQPPRHLHRQTADGHERVSNVSGRQAGGRTHVCFSMPLKPTDTEDVALLRGAPVHLILAWSHEADFDHHSAQRDSVEMML
jgi:hypothetical protein